MIKVKICGITNEKDAIWATNLGADYLGFNFYKNSPRKISPELAKKILAKLPSFVSVVGVFVNEEIKNVLKIIKKCGFNLVQLHGEESAEYCQNLKLRITNYELRIIKAFRIEDEESLKVVPEYMDKVDYFLLDTLVPGMEGGSGETFNWDLAVRAKELTSSKPMFLAGGLTPENVLEAVKKVQPYAVDVASGVERLPRRKDYEKMRQFITAIKIWDSSPH